jgi:hypothetical protein
MAEIFDAKEAWRRTVKIIKSNQLTIEQVMDKIQSAIDKGDSRILVTIDKGVKKQLKKLKYKVEDGFDPSEYRVSWRRGKIK